MGSRWGGRKIIFQNREPALRYNIRNDYHQSYRKRRSGTGNHKFSGVNLVQKILPRSDYIGKVTKSSTISKKFVCKKKLTRDQEILDIVTGYTIPMLSRPNQKRNFTERINHDRKRFGRFVEQGSHILPKSRGGSVSKLIISSSQKRIGIRDQ